MLSPDRALELQGAHAFLGFTEQKHSHEPNFQSQVSIMENCLGGYAELVAAFAAFKLRVVGKFVHALALAAKAFSPEGPAQFLEQGAALIVGRIRVSEVCESHG